MKKIIAIALIAAGVVILIARGFNYTKETHKADLGFTQLEFKEQGRVNIPVWVGVVLVAAGAAVLLIPKREAE